MHKIRRTFTTAQLNFSYRFNFFWNAFINRSILVFECLPKPHLSTLCAYHLLQSFSFLPSEQVSSMVISRASNQNNNQCHKCTRPKVVHKARRQLLKSELLTIDASYEESLRFVQRPLPSAAQFSLYLYHSWLYFPEPNSYEIPWLRQHFEHVPLYGWLIENSWHCNSFEICTSKMPKAYNHRSASSCSGSSLETFNKQEE